ncbi:AlpA family transcriptional regulator [Vibrio sp. ZSDZ65]|uniref:AlpA family transcriptional regulator n=1 Tax=Vibrio qingdaonensis TaxID=2829491 RepID=A0A9X3CMH3_9VIBR|nr:AlpA family transcriptional regulator [Vibrio qingdaonensis]MCW8346091.1 AlpA family transcriptional regulator [Vibrio qingdaonensis]
MPMNQYQTVTDRIVRIKELTQLTGLSRSTIYDKINSRSPRYDATFPKSLKLGSRAVGWLSTDVSRWIESKVLTHQVEGELER